MKIPDVTSWDWIFSEVEKFCSRNNISENKKRIIVEGYKEIREVLREDFLKKSSNSMIPSLCNFAPWYLQKNADFGQKLKLLKDRKGFEDVKRDLVQDNFENSFGAEAVVEVTGNFIEKGLEVELIKRKKGERTPDLRIKKVDNKWVYFEITTFRTYSSEHQKILQFWSKLSGCVNQICLTHERFIEVDFNGMSIRNAKECFDVIISKIQEMVQSPEEFEETVCGVNLKILKKEEGYGPPNIHGIKLTTDEMHAISRKLSEKIEKKQLPHGECGVLLVFTRSPFLPDFEDLAENLMKIVNNDPNLDAAVIQYISHKQLGISVGSNKFKIVHRSEYDGIYNCYNIIIPNPNFRIENGISQFLSTFL